MKKAAWVAVFVWMLGLSSVSRADVIKVAVAANFAEVMKQLAGRFEAESGHQVKLSTGSTGKLYAQIENGAPFDLFFAADEKRPQLLEQSGQALPGSRMTYALGQLVLWSPDSGLIHPDLGVLRQPVFSLLAIANPKTAPYGRAAQETLEKLGLWTTLQPRLVRGENIGQTFQFVSTGNAALGFVAKSQVYHDGTYRKGSHWEVPADQHSPIVQQVVQLKSSAAARAFLDYVVGPEARELIQSYGYGTPAAPRNP